MLGREHGRGTGHKHTKFSAHGGTGGLGTAGCAATSLPVRMPQMTMRLELTLNLPASSCMGRCFWEPRCIATKEGKHARLGAEGGVWECAPRAGLCVSVPKGVGAVNRMYPTKVC